MKEIPLTSYAIDFDNTICDTHFNPQTGEYDMGEVLPYMAEAIDRCAEGHEIVIFTARPLVEHDQVQDWLVKHDITYNMITNVKRPALRYVDDRSQRPDEFISLYGTRRPHR